MINNQQINLKFQTDYIVLDIETTGFVPQENEITEIAAILVDGRTHQEKAIFTSLCKINKKVPWRITKLTGINDYMLREANDLKKVLKELAIFCKSLPIYAHYAPFDKSFIRFNLIKHRVIYTKSRWVDTINIFKSRWPKRKTYKLESLIVDFNLATHEDHCALSDARHTLALIKRCFY